MDRKKKRPLCSSRGHECAGTCKCQAAGQQATHRPHQPGPHFPTSLKAVLLAHNTELEQLLVRPHSLPLKCRVCGTPAFSGAAFPSSLASPSQGLSPSSSGDSSPPLPESCSPADAFVPSKEPSLVPVGFGRSSVEAASQPEWQIPASSCPSAVAASVGKDRDYHVAGKREPLSPSSPTSQHMQTSSWPR